MQTTDAADYRKTRTRQVTLGEQSLTLLTRPGFADWSDVTPAMQLIAVNASLDTGTRVLIGPCGHGALGVWAARHTGASAVTCMDSNLVATKMARATLDQNGVSEATVSCDVPQETDGPWDVFMMLLPKGRDLARLWLLNGILAMPAGGSIYVAGANRAGIKSFVRDAEALLGRGIIMRYKGGNRVVRFVRPENLPDPLPEHFCQPGIRNGTYATFDVMLAERKCAVYTRPGVFSRAAMDQGTALLIESIALSPGERVLDLGCGYGVVGLHAALSSPDSAVTLVDVDSLACECAVQTLNANHVTHADVRQGDGLAAVPGQRFSLIASNPPFHAGLDVSLEMTAAFIAEAYSALERNGRLLLVANRFLTYQRMLEDRFGHVTVLQRTPQYQVLGATRRR